MCGEEAARSRDGGTSGEGKRRSLLGPGIGLTAGLVEKVERLKVDGLRENTGLNFSRVGQQFCVLVINCAMPLVCARVCVIAGLNAHIFFYSKTVSF